MNRQSFALVVAEKPSVATGIANVIIRGFQKKKGFLEGEGYLISWCLGHLAEPAQPEVYRDEWQKWSLDSLPILPDKWMYVIKESTKEQFHVLSKLMNREDVSEVICATDAGREGELIFRLVYEMAGCDKPIKRLWVSSMEESAIREGFENLQSGSDYDNLYHSALCRQKADWLVGINGTRLYTSLYGGRILKVGRVQTPTLAMLVDREMEIRNFRKEKYYKAHILMDGMDAVTEHIDDMKKAEKITGACQNGQALVTSVRREEKAAAPPRLYDLTSLQRNANRLLGFTAKQSLEYAQSLYEKKIITYPRTDSRFLSADMVQTAECVTEAVRQLFMHQENKEFHPTVKRVLNSSKVTDHHAIIPTLEIAGADISALPETERKILLLIANRLLCAVGENHVYETVSAEFSCGGQSFTVCGKSVMHNGWKYFEDDFNRFIPIRQEEQDGKKLPKLSEGQVFDNVQTKISAHFTSPPKHFTEDSLLSAMEKAGAADAGREAERKGLGTPATRADIIEKLIKDGFVKREKRQLISTDDGIRLIDVLPDTIKSPKLTAEWENSLALVSDGKMTADDFMSGIINMVREFMSDYRMPDAVQKHWFAYNHVILGACPKCGADIVKGKFGAYCLNRCGMQVSGYFSAKFTDQQVTDLLDGKKVLLKGLIGKNGKPYDLFIKPDGIEKYSYEKKGKTVVGYRFSFEKSYPVKKACERRAE